MLGWAQEHGPYIMEDGSTEFVKNPYAWNKEASVIYIESPAGVGFSICGKTEECNFNDSNSADDNLIAVLNLMTMKFPELKDNDLYLSGESYAGIYVPYLAQRIDTYIKQAKHNKTGGYIPNLKGFMIGNGVTDWRFDTTPALFEMSQMHGLIPIDLYNFMKKNCTNPDGQFNENLSQDCYGAASRFYDYMDSINIYDIYGKCYGKDPALLL
jgi:carboxypeptidase C (cathepsin A)